MFGCSNRCVVTRRGSAIGPARNVGEWRRIYLPFRRRRARRRSCAPGIQRRELNASGNGRVIDTMRRMVIGEQDKAVTMEGETITLPSPTGHLHIVAKYP